MDMVVDDEVFKSFGKHARHSSAALRLPARLLPLALCPVPSASSHIPLVARLSVLWQI
jgi:hypothetical protein